MIEKLKTAIEGKVDELNASVPSWAKLENKSTDGEIERLAECALQRHAERLGEEAPLEYAAESIARLIVLGRYCDSVIGSENRHA